MEMLPFNLPVFKKWIARLSPYQVKVACVVELPDGEVQHYGSPELGVRVFSKVEKLKRRSSLVWIPPTPLPLQNVPLSNYYMNQNKVRMEAKKVLKHFMAAGQSYGEGGFWHPWLCTNIG